MHKLPDYGKKILSPQRYMEFHEGEKKMVAAADCHNASFGRHPDCGGPKLFAVAFYIRFILG